MIYIINGQEMEGKAYSLQFENDMMNGVLLDFPKTYSFLSDHVPDHAEMIDGVEEAGEMDCYDLTEAEIDWEHPPHSWVFKSVVKIMVESAEQLCIEACDE